VSIEIPRKEDGTMAEKGYAGKIKNTGVQNVKGPYAGGQKKGKSTVKTGNDLRNGKTGK
jgi:hypothetical protein